MVERRWYPLSPEQEAVATELVVLREERKISQAQAARECGMSKARLSEVEKADRPPNREELNALLKIYDAMPATHRRLYSLADQKVEDSDNWWLPKHRWVPDSLAYIMRSEQRASEVYTSQGQYVPALLQTEHYMRELMKSFGATEVQVKRGAEVRLGRQSSFFKDSNREKLQAILAESVLDVGPRDMLLEQLKHLVKATKRRYVEIRVIDKRKLLPVAGSTLFAFDFKQRVGYADGGFGSVDVVRMRGFKELEGMNSRHASYVEASMSPDESMQVIERYIAKYS